MKTCYLNLKKSIHRLQLLCLVGCFIIPIGCQSQSSKRPVEKSTAKTDQEWKAQLTPLQYYVLRQKGTEKPGNNPYNKFFKEGTYHCAACDKLLYRSEYKYVVVVVGLHLIVENHKIWPMKGIILWEWNDLKFIVKIVEDI